MSLMEILKAKKIVLAPAEKGIIVSMGTDLLRRRLFMTRAAKGDVIIPELKDPTYDLASELRVVPEDAEKLENLKLALMPFDLNKPLELEIMETVPSGRVTIVEDTEIELVNEKR